MDTGEIDKLILSVAAFRWQKVAMLIVRATDLKGLIPAEAENAFEFVAERIQALVHAGLLEARGDVSQWRHSEVRRAH